MIPALVFSCENCEFFQDTYLVEHLKSAAYAWIFKSTNEKNVSGIYCPYKRKKGNAHVVLSIACPNNELKDYSDKPLKQKSVQNL